MPLKNKSTADVSNLKVTSDAHLSQTDVGTSATVTNINPSISTDIPHISASLNATVNTTGAATATNLHPVSISEKPHVTSGVHANTGEATDHRSLKHLDYENSGHTGFASSAQLKAALQAEVIVSSQSGQINADDLNKLKSNLSAKIELGGQVLSLTAKAGKKWTYTSALNSETGDMIILTLDTSNGTYTSQTRNPARDELNAHITDTNVHVRAGERGYWNNKVTASVDVENEKLILER